MLSVSVYTFAVLAGTDILSYILFREDDGDSELGYMDKLTQQRAALSHLLAEKQKLLETQEHLKRLRQNDAMTQVEVIDILTCSNLTTVYQNLYNS